MTDRMLIKNARIVLTDQVTSALGWAIIENGVFTAIGDGDAPDMDYTIDAGGQFIFPGLIDLQINGGGGINFNDVKTKADLETILQANLATGTTSLLATFISDTTDAMCDAIETVATVEAPNGAEILGLHVEGPFLSPEKPGMHSHVIAPDMGVAQKLLKAGNGKVKIMTLAPELPGAKDVIEFLGTQHVIVSMGHSMASYEEAKAGIAAGATMATHLFNAMPNIHHRNPGMIPALLNSEIAIGMIADGMHVQEPVLEMIFKIHGPDFFLISDAIAPLGTENKSYEAYGETIVVRDGICYNPRGTIAGSAIPLFNGVIRLHRKLGFLLPDAVHMASLLPAQLIGAHKTIGSIEQGKQADFLLVDKNFTLKEVYKRGVKSSAVFNLL